MPALAGSRLASRGRIQDPAHALELAPDEIGPIVRDGSGPSGDELASPIGERAVEKRRHAAHDEKCREKERHAHQRGARVE